jgi:hypothetical protein
MSVIKVNNITNLDGTSGPVIAGIATVSSTSHLVVPTGDTRTRDPELITSGLTFHIDAGISSSYSGIGIQVNNIGSAGLAYTGFWQGTSSTGSSVIYSEEGGGSWFLEGNGTTFGSNNYLRVGAAGTSGAGIGNTTALGVGSSLTVSIWHYPVRLGGNVSGNGYMLFNNHFQGSGTVSGLVFNSSSDGTNITFQTRFNNTCCQTQTSTSSSSYSGWQNWTATWDGSTKRIYLNGNEIAATQSATGTNQMLNALYFGVNADTHAGLGDSGPETSAYRGYLSKVMIYNRAITETEIHQNYAAVKSRYTGIQ